MPKHPFTAHPFITNVSSRIGKLVAVCCADTPRRGLLVGLSGGPDSVALLLAAKAWSDEVGAPLAAAHFNHRLRPGEADRDALFCRDLCAELGIELHEDGEDPRPVARSRGQGLEEAARHLRLRFFRKVLAGNPALQCTATGHHRDDQVETVIMRLFRGTGPGGLRGILPVSGKVIHPLLQVGRGEIIAFLEDIGQPWRTDATNLDGDNIRARIRRELLPLVRGIFGSGSENVPARLADLLQQDMELLDHFTQEALAKVRLPDHPDQLSVARLLALDKSLAARVLRLWLVNGQPSGLERVHVDGVLAWLVTGQSGSGLDLADGLRLTRNFDRLECKAASNVPPPLRKAEDYRILVSRNPAGKGDPRAGIQEGVGDPADETSWRLTCPASSLAGNLRVRNWNPGDRFQPFGLEGSKKLSDILRERQVSRDDRPGVLVVTDDTGILWVVGLARAERTRLLPSTEQTVTISVANRTEHPKQGNDN
ncbi:MAG: tRNA lysidine(34) synthetase TilS [Candidatus Krumholzibacteria bacterium]|nr:tRNA lysidine(34) synthetase TilS [Candidatus Krumholzibacteria bacterium]